MGTISLCMITKNEEKTLDKCLNSVKEIADEIIIADTGSTDKTKDIAKKFKAKIFDFKWDDDFSAARNESIKHATKDWILVLDADETLDKKDLSTIKDFTKAQDADAFMFIQKNYTNDSSIAGFMNEEHKLGDKTYSGWYGSRIARLFRNKKNFKFEGVVHELVENSVENNGGKLAVTNVTINHYGNADSAIKKKKMQLYLELCKRKAKESKSSRSYFELGVLYKENGNTEEAINSFKKAVDIDPNNSMALYELGVIYEHLQNFDEAIKNYSESLKIKETSETFQNLGVCYIKKGMMKEAYDKLVKAMLLNPNNPSIYNSLGALCERMGNYDSAIQMLEVATKLNPKNTIGFYNLGISFDRKGDFEKALPNYEKAVELKHNKSDDIKKRIKEIKIILANAPKFKYGFEGVKAG